MTFSAFCTSAFERAFPYGMAENLTAIHTARVKDCLVELQRYSRYLRTRHHTRFVFTDTYYQFGTTLAAKPSGKVLGVYTYTLQDESDKSFYTLSDPLTVSQLLAVEQFQQPPAGVHTTTDGEIVASANAAGVYLANLTQDKGWRAASGVFALERVPDVNGVVLNPTGRFVVVHPNIESGEVLVVRWEGKKTTYADTDILDFGDYDIQVMRVVEAHLLLEAAAKDDRSVTDVQVFGMEKAAALRDLLLDIKEDNEAEEPEYR